MLLLLIMHYLQGMIKVYLAGEILQAIFVFYRLKMKSSQQVVIVMHQQNLKVSQGKPFILASLIIDYHSVFGNTFARQCHKLSINSAKSATNSISEYHVTNSVSEYHVKNMYPCITLRPNKLLNNYLFLVHKIGIYLAKYLKKHARACLN